MGYLGLRMMKGVLREFLDYWKGCKEEYSADSQEGYLEGYKEHYSEDYQEDCSGGFLGGLLGPGPVVAFAGNGVSGFESGEQPWHAHAGGSCCVLGLRWPVPPKLIARACLGVGYSQQWRLPGSWAWWALGSPPQLQSVVWLYSTLLETRTKESSTCASSWTHTYVHSESDCRYLCTSNRPVTLRPVWLEAYVPGPERWWTVPVESEPGKTQVEARSDTDVLAGAEKQRSRINFKSPGLRKEATKLGRKFFLLPAQLNRVSA